MVKVSTDVLKQVAAPLFRLDVVVTAMINSRTDNPGVVVKGANRVADPIQRGVRVRLWQSGRGR
jgi:hypothetical protein